MASPSKRKGDKAELEVAGILNDLLGITCRRQLGAGRKDDMGDVQELVDTLNAWGVMVDGNTFAGTGAVEAAPMRSVATLKNLTSGLEEGGDG